MKRENPHLAKTRKRCHITCRQQRLTREEQKGLTVPTSVRSILIGMRIVRRSGTDHLQIIIGETPRINMTGGLQINITEDYLKKDLLKNMTEDLQKIITEGLQKNMIEHLRK